MNLEDKATELLTQVQTAAQNIAPQALDLAIQHTYWSCLLALCAGGAAALVGICFLTAGYRRAQAFDWSPYGACDCLCIIQAIIGLIALIPGLAQIFDIWNWIGALNPKVALFHQVIVKLLSSS